MKRLALWFRNRIKTVMEHNDYPKDCLTVKDCSTLGECGWWTPVDLIIREQLNNGGGSARGFLGLTPSECKKSYYYACEHKELLKELDLVNKSAVNNSGFPLWNNYDF